ncbi:MAG: SHD1 domain-containing protein [Pirellula sp.]
MFLTPSTFRKTIAKTWTTVAVSPLLFVGLQLDISAQDKTPRLMTWTDSSGKIKTEAEFIKLEGVKLFLKKADGKEVAVTLNRLDDKSRLRARSIAKRGLSSLDSGPIPVAGPPVVFPSNPSAAEFKDIIVAELKKNNFIVLWDALPANKQNQVEDLVKLASTKIEQRTLDLVKKFRSDLFATLKSKKEFLLNSKSLTMVPPDERSKIAEAYDPIVAVLDSAFSVELLDVKNLQESNLRDLVNNYLINVIAKSKAIEEFIPPEAASQMGAMNAMDDVKVETVSAREVTVRWSPQSMAPPEKFVLVDGRWLPESMLKQWDSAIAQATKAIQAADPKEVHRSVGKGVFAMTSLMGAFSLAETQQDFDEAMQQLTDAAMMAPSMMMGLPGGPMGQPSSPGGPPSNNQGRPTKKMPIAG